MLGCCRCFVGTSMVLRSSRTIGRGQSVSENYGPIFTHRNLADRQTSLKGRYWFQCRCQPCTSKWSMYDGQLFLFLFYFVCLFLFFFWIYLSSILVCWCCFIVSVCLCLLGFLVLPFNGWFLVVDECEWWVERDPFNDWLKGLEFHWVDGRRPRFDSILASVVSWSYRNLKWWSIIIGDWNYELIDRLIDWANHCNINDGFRSFRNWKSPDWHRWWMTFTLILV